MLLYVLIDYDNLSRLDRTRGIKTVILRIISKLTMDEVVNIKNIVFRLYGGWYQSNNLSKRAQDLIIEINKYFPSIFTIPCNSKKVVVKVELAYSLLITPSEHLLDTFRIRSFPKDIKCDDPNKHGCTDPNCPIRNVFSFINNGTINGQCCSVKPEDILYRGQQKLVDTMLSMDIFYLSMSIDNSIVVVSSDDDFWPAIRSSIQLGTKIFHIHTRNNRNTPLIYSKHVNSLYQESFL